jgi:AraC-like DNA-binding protein
LDEASQGWLVCRWGRDTPASERRLIAPDGCTDVVWLGDRLIFAGPDSRAVPASAGAAGPTAGVRLRPWAATAIFGISLADTVNRRIPLDAIEPRETDALEDRLQGVGSLAASQELAAYVMGRAQQARPVDHLVARAGAVISCSGGRISIERVAEELHYSQRQLHRRFVRAVGYSPKTYARIVRFQRARALIGDSGCSLEAIARRCGFADGAHMTRELTALGGSAPSSIRSETFKAARVRSGP